MSEIVQNSAGEGNTNSSPEKQISPAKKWCGTFNNYTEEEYKELISAFSASKLRYIVGKEVGEQGTPHLQIYFDSQFRTRPTVLKLNHKKIHWERAKGSDLQNYLYCSKDEKFIDNFPEDWKKKNNLLKPKHIITDDQVNNCWWEVKAINYYKKHLKKYDDRTIYWFWGEKGCAGKTNFCKYLITKYNFGFLSNAKTADVAFHAAETMKNAYCINYTRSNEDSTNYQAIEMLKDGLIFSGKYESKQIVMDSPFIICFSNYKPDTSKLSLDRWKIINIEKDKKKTKL